jgi:alcohol dehydrogenase (cytochrome c)
MSGREMAARSRRKYVRAKFFVAILLAGMCASIATAQVRPEDLVKGPGENWLTYLGDYTAHRFSSLDQINRDTVSHLVPVWVRHVEGDADRPETVPLVYNGVMYATKSNGVFALDPVTGREIWHYEASGVPNLRRNRGAAILGDRVYFETSDCHLVALQRMNGAVIWDREIASFDKGYFCTVAPLAVKDKIIVGVASSGLRCFVAALSADTGQEDWRFWTIPGKNEPLGKTWGNFPADWGEVPTWTTGSYDPGLNTLYWSTGNPWPDLYGGERPGDNLYSDCVLALDLDSGKLKWYFQFTPHDVHDWDANETNVLLDADFQGHPRKLLIQANRNGFYYVLDRTNGQFLLAKQFINEQNWAKGIDAKGRPIEIPNLEPSPSGTRVCPSLKGATNWWAPSIDPSIGLLYVVTLERCEIFFSSRQNGKPPGVGYYGTASKAESNAPGDFSLRAIDAQTGEIRWQYPLPGPVYMWAGTLATAGGLVFTADPDGDLVALDNKTGKDLWHFFMGSTLYTAPMTFEVDGKQYVSMTAGTNLFTFALFNAKANSQ